MVNLSGWWISDKSVMSKNQPWPATNCVVVFWLPKATNKSFMSTYTRWRDFLRFFWKRITSELEHLLGTEYCFWKLTKKISHKIFSVMLIVVILSWWITSEQIMSQTKLKRQNKSQKTDILRIILILHTHENQFLNPKHLGLCYFDMPLT